MSRRKKLDRYPDRYWTLIEKAWKTPIFIPCEDAFRARSVRNDLYNFRKALEEESETTDRLSLIADKAKDLVFSILSPDEDNKTPRLLIYRRQSLNTIPPEVIYNDD